MTSVSIRELRRDVSGVLRRVEHGERMRITIHGRPVAELVPLPRPRTLPWRELIRDLRQADAGLARELAELMRSTTDEA
ncbi:MAG: type II toxin-antitoxin system prevent-host-death family antitoxin [Chloroflexota bacterium]|nr:type II toxin-antitoxin system prevent-host-death family antitoxin [Chloroflexota bacterium]